jgi:hypothetical protein
MEQAQLFADRSATPYRHSPEARRKSGRSAVTNGSTPMHGVDGRTWPVRRFSDILNGILADKGGRSNVTEIEYQLARNYASISVYCEQIQARVFGAAAPEFRQAIGGGEAITPHDVLTEASRLMHRMARGNRETVDAFVGLKGEERAETVALLEKAADLALKQIAAGDAVARDLELLSVFAQRLARLASIIGIERTPRVIGPTLGDLMREAVANPPQYDPELDDEVMDAAPGGPGSSQERAGDGLGDGDREAYGGGDSADAGGSDEQEPTT